MGYVRVVLASFLAATFACGAAAGEWRQVKVPGADSAVTGSPEPVWYRCFIRAPEQVATRVDDTVMSESVTVSLAGLHGAYAVYVNGKEIAHGDALPDEPRKRVKVPKGLLQPGKFNVLAIRLDAKAAAKGIDKAPILAGYYDEVVLTGTWEARAGAQMDDPSMKPPAAPPTLAAFTEANFHQSSSPLTANPVLIHGHRLPPLESLAAMKTPDDLKVDLVLSEPTVAQPTHISFDERGRMWVAQYRQYPYPSGVKMISRDRYYRGRYNKVPPAPPYQDRGADIISVHESTRGDGVYDKSKVVLDGLNLADAALRGHGGIWVMNPPYLMFYPDADGDDKPDDDPQVRLSGFGIEDAHAVANGLIWGPDGWLYGAQGSTTTSRVVRPGIDRPDSPGVYFEGSTVWRYHPEKKIFETFAQGGANMWGLDFDSQGRLFGGTNGDIGHGYYFVQGGQYLRAVVAQKYGPAQSPYAFGALNRMASSNPVPRFTISQVVYEGTALPQRYFGQFIGVNTLLHKLVSESRHFVGSAISTSDTGFPVTSSDLSFRPVYITSGPDGAIYFADFYEQYIAHGQHYQGMIDPTSGRIYRLRGKDQPLEKDVNLAVKTTQQLIATLSHPDRWHRFTAVRLLGERRDNFAIEPLKEMLLAPSGKPSLEALWVLYQMDALDDATWHAALAHPSAPVRAWAIRLAGDTRHLEPAFLKEIVVAMAAEPDAEVRQQVASTAARLPAEQDLALISALLHRDADQADAFIPMLCWWAIEPHCDADRAAVFAMLDEPAAWNGKMMTQSILPRLMKRFAMKGSHADFLSCAQLLRKAPSDEDRRLLIAAFEEAFKGRAPPPLPVELASALAASGHASTSLRVRLGEQQATQKALKLLADPKADAAERLTFAMLFGEVKVPQAVAPLIAIARADPKPELRKAALTALTLYDDEMIGLQVAAFYAELPATIKPAALNLLASRPTWAAALLDLVKTGKIKPSEIPLDIVMRLKSDADEKLATEANALFPAPPPTGPQAMRLEAERIRRILDTGTGDPYKGEPIFMQRCAPCHTLFYKGGHIGPNLSDYQRQDTASLLRNILEPSAEVREGFENYTVRTKDGRTLSGILVDDDPSILVIRGTDGQDTRVPHDQVKSMKKSTLSLMPEGLLEGMSDQELRDFFAYLRIPQPITQ